MYRFFIFFCVLHLSASVKGQCYIDQETTDTAIIAVDDSLHYIDPQSDSTTRSVVGANLSIYTTCPGGQLTLSNVVMPRFIHAECSAGNNFTVGTKTRDFSKLQCTIAETDRPTVEVHQTTKPCVNQVGKETELGYYFGDNDTKFARLITVCFDTKTLIPLFSFFTLSDKKTVSQPSSRAPKFSKINSFYGTSDLDAFYRITNQQNTFDTLLGTNAVTISSSVRLSRGHLTANADFHYKLQRDATFHYDNTAPQWLSFNSGNWGQLEAAIRTYVKENCTSSQTVYTGTLGISTSKNKNGADVALYLDINAKIPVPKWFWKLVDYTATNSTHYIFFGYNNVIPTVTVNDALADLKNSVCTKVVDLAKIPRMPTFGKTQKAGFMFACQWDQIKTTSDLYAILKDIKNRKMFRHKFSRNLW